MNICRRLGVTTALTLEDKVNGDTIWCGTFQLIWNDLKNDLAKQDIIFTPQMDIVENLNKETFKNSDISDKYYYKKIGRPSIELKHEIEEAIKQRFNETSNILNDFEWEGRDTNDYFLYVMLKKQFEFKKEFEEMEKGTFRESENVSYFGISRSSENDEVKRQVEVLYYNDKNDFAIKIKTKQEDEVILCKNPKGETFSQIYNSIEEEKTNYKGSNIFIEGELLKIPNIKLNEKKEFTQIEQKPFEFSNGDVYEIEKAIQTIEIELDRKGVKIKSEAGMMLNAESAIVVDKPREFVVDDTFAIFLKEEDKSVPYFAGLINDITKFQ